ncbi:putative zinc-binding metallopeptidase [Mariniblastus fucicola]|uniref:Zinc-binding metallo-peptidase n=1 Tax=Mariniblastus fucicola TaxID=980251 RepID=A0A5B9P4F5_9BACT|nr:putative zinc-binding metallopeptidase [Mariniblastus fucicola]QEG21134.1 hypothetical protein MFFC18_09880 [Mariniblastus fucicola]
MSRQTKASKKGRLASDWQRIDSNAASVEAPSWARLKDDQLLDLQINDLGVSLDDNPHLVQMRDQLYSELSSRNLQIKPHVWLSDEWFVPDGIPGIAIPFYMASPRLMRLERKQMLEVEGGSKPWCMRILRHEAGHAIDIAFRLHRRKRYREVFGRYNDPYPEYYRPKPRSKNYVQHLEPWYAQSHPAEDFAETFAVWLQSKSKRQWQQKYQGWKALEKITYVDQLMHDIANKKPPVKSRVKVDPVHKLKHTLRAHYEERHARYDINYPTSFDQDLKKLFTQPAKTRRNKTAAAFLERNRQKFCRQVGQWTGEYQYNINQVIRVMIDRCRSMDLRVPADNRELERDTLLMLTVHTMNYLYRGNHRVAL